MYLCKVETRFYNDIYEILRSCGDKGLPVGVIAKQVYNRHAGLFNSDLTYDKVYRYTRFFLWAQARRPASPFTFGESRGRYALKPHIYEQMELQFTDEPEDMTSPNANKEEYHDDYPSLF